MSSTPTLDEIAASGGVEPKPSADYLERLHVIDNVVRECIHVSKQYAGIKSPTSRHFYASVLFTSLVTKGVSLAIFCPLSPWAEKMIEHWDYGSLTGVVRSMLETRLNFFYLCVEACTDEEWDCRWNLFNLHDSIARRRLFEAQQEMTGAEVSDIASFSTQADEVRQRLNANNFFLALPEKQRNKFLKGRDAHLYPLEEIAERAGVGRGVFKYLHVLFSQHVHGLPMSFYRMGGDYPERGRGLPSEVEESYAALCLSFAATLLTGARDELHELFVGLSADPKPAGPTSSENDHPRSGLLQRLLEAVASRVR
ncbi:DUF5677 domain-containing protein [Bradyrhizobium sp. 150]|uniref:DUF5677 domain-containing protein n=1 Tax=Bradyrhizobium sp. 150 TaxID=2782625 RepID=UPI001FFA11E0|nr:DUF5677 domain-containing protein [Bradyrhizobium sp. 150]MCK1670412.1 hypothetical protein [Bradyrhizobium sp. 150]